MGNPTGKCRLCLQAGKLLLDSHLIPKYLYKRLRTPSLRDSNPVVITAKVVKTSSRQVKDYLLCEECEDRFNKGGERWISLNGMSDGVFPLRDALRATQPVATLDKAQLYCTTALPSQSTDKFSYFAGSVFWRAAVHEWRNEEFEIKKLELGPYEEPLRLFLIGQTAFPSNMALWVTISSSDHLSGSIMFPYLKNRSDYRQFHFAISDIAFDLFVGFRIADEIHKMSIAGGVVALSETVEKNFVEWAGNKLRTAKTKMKDQKFGGKQS